MSAPVRFLFVAIGGWALFRGVTVGVLPGADAFTVPKAEAAPPPIVPTQFPPIAPVERQPQIPAEYESYPGFPAYAAYQPPRPRYLPVPVYYYPAAAAARTVSVPLPPSQSATAPDQPPQFYSPIPQLEEWDLAQITRESVTGLQQQSSPVPAGAATFIRRSI